MPNLKRKSEFSLLSSKELLKSSYYTNACNPAYYSCFQLMKYKVKNVLRIDYSEQEKEISQQKTNSHGYIIRKIENFIAKKDKRQASLFSRRIRDLKEMREIADYKEEIFNKEKCLDVIEKAEDLLREIETIK